MRKKVKVNKQNSNIKILIVEDEQIVALDLSKSLASLGYNVISFVKSGEQAIELTQKEQPNLILMDIRLAGKLDGIETALKINSMYDIPIIYLTANADISTIERAKNAALYGYVLKPFDLKEINISIQMALFKHELEKRVKESEKWLSTTIRSIGEAIVATDNNYKIKFVNPTAEKLTGWNVNEILGKDVNDIVKLINEINNQEINEPFSKVLEEGNSINMQNYTILIRKDGEKKPVVINASPIVDDSKNIVGAVVSFQDISERKEIEDRIKASEAELKALFSSMTDAIFVLSRDGKYLKIAPTNPQLLYKPANELEGKKLDEIFPEESAKKYIDLINEALNKNITINSEYSLNINNEEKWFSVSISPMLKDSVVWVARDITERIETEKALRESEERFRELVELSPDAIGIHKDGVLLFVNSSGAKLLGEENEEKVLGKNLLDIIHPDSRKLFIERMKATKEGKTAPLAEIKIIRKDGKIINIESSAIPFQYKNMQAVQFVARDITSHKIADEEKETLFKKVSEAQDRLKILSRRLIEVQESERRHISRELHDEIGQSLTAAKINIQTLNNLSESKNIKKNLSESIELVENALNQVRNLSLDLRPSILDDLGLVPAIRWYLRRQSQRSGIKTKLSAENIEMKFQPEIEITCFRVLQEALTNILRHSEALNIVVNLWVKEEKLYLKINDDGKGFDVNSARARAIAGESIGILGMQERVELLGGFFEVYSTHEKGTEILAIFPLNLRRKSFAK